MKRWTANSIRQLRETAGMTQKQLANWLGVVPMHVSHLEQGVRPPGNQTARLMTLLAQRVKANATKPVRAKRRMKR
jgi:DNA-binding transcriptional regulator YiaG